MSSAGGSTGFPFQGLCNQTNLWYSTSSFTAALRLLTLRLLICHLSLELVVNSNMRKTPSTCNLYLWSRSQKKAASLDGFIGKGKAELALSPWKEHLRNSTKKGKKKNPKGKGISEKTYKYEKKGKCFRAYHKQVFSLTSECYQVVLY